MSEDEKDYGSFNPIAKRNYPGICGKCPYLNIHKYDTRVNKNTKLIERLYRCNAEGHSHVIGYINETYELNGMGCSITRDCKINLPEQLSLF